MLPQSTRFLEELRRASDAGEKSYAFDDQHEKTVLADRWFQESQDGLVLFLVFYSLACRWSRCISCNLPCRSSQFHVDYKALIAQIDSIFSSPDVLEKSLAIRKVIVSNNGSVLDQETFSSTALMYLMAKLNLHFPNLRVVSIETRPEFVEVPELEFLARALKEGETSSDLEIAIGLEVFDEKIRNDVLNKGLQLSSLEKLVRWLARYHFRLKCYLMQKAVPEMTDVAAIKDVHHTIDYLDGLSRQHNLPINLHLNPTYVARGTKLEAAFLAGEYTPPKLADVVKAVVHGKDKAISIFVGLYDEGLAAPGGSFIRPGDEKLVDLLGNFNQTQDYTALAAAL